MPDTPILRTARLLLAIPGGKAAEAQVRFYRANVTHLAPWEPPITPDHFDEAFQRKWLASHVDQAGDGSAYRFAIFDREAGEGGDILGHVNLTNIIRGVSQSCFLGYNLAQCAQGKGYMTEACEAVVAFAFNELGMHRVGAGYMPHNERSAAVLRRLGFTIEGTAKAYLYIAGAWRDHVLTSLTNPQDIAPA